MFCLIFNVEGMLSYIFMSVLFQTGFFSLSTDELGEPIRSEFGVTVLSAGIGHNEVSSKSNGPLTSILMFNVKCTICIYFYKGW